MKIWFCTSAVALAVLLKLEVRHAKARKYTVFQNQIALLFILAIWLSKSIKPFKAKDESYLSNWCWAQVSYKFTDNISMTLQILNHFHTLLVVCVYSLCIEAVHNSWEVACRYRMISSSPYSSLQSNFIRDSLSLLTKTCNFNSSMSTNTLAVLMVFSQCSANVQ